MAPSSPAFHLCSEVQLALAPLDIDEVGHVLRFATRGDQEEIAVDVGDLPDALLQALAFSFNYKGPSAGISLSFNKPEWTKIAEAIPQCIKSISVVYEPAEKIHSDIALSSEEHLRRESARLFRIAWNSKRLDTAFVYDKVYQLDGLRGIAELKTVTIQVTMPMNSMTLSDYLTSVSPLPGVKHLVILCLGTIKLGYRYSHEKCFCCNALDEDVASISRIFPGLTSLKVTCYKPRFSLRFIEKNPNVQELYLMHNIEDYAEDLRYKNCGVHLEDVADTKRLIPIVNTVLKSFDTPKEMRPIDLEALKECTKMEEMKFRLPAARNEEESNEIYSAFYDAIARMPSLRGVHLAWENKPPKVHSLVGTNPEALLMARSFVGSWDKSEYVENCGRESDKFSESIAIGDIAEACPTITKLILQDVSISGEQLNKAIQTLGPHLEILGLNLEGQDENIAERLARIVSLVVDKCPRLKEIRFLDSLFEGCFRPKSENWEKEMRNYIACIERGRPEFLNHDSLDSIKEFLEKISEMYNDLNLSSERLVWM